MPVRMVRKRAGGMREAQGLLHSPLRAQPQEQMVPDTLVLCCEPMSMSIITVGQTRRAEAASLCVKFIEKM